MSGDHDAAEAAVRELTTIERHAASLVRRATLQDMPSQPATAESAAGSESGDLDGDEAVRIIPGSDKLVPGGIPVKGGASQIHSLQAKYNPYAAVQ